jgi:cyanophycinase-like exopeptidase
VGLLHHVHVDRRFDDTKQGGITARRSAALTDFLLGKGIAAFAVTDRHQRMRQRIGQVLRTLPVMLQEMIGHPLR